MKNFLRPGNNESGFILVFTMLILVVLVLLGIASTTSTTTELQIAANDRFHRTTFYGTDGAVFTTPKVIGIAIEKGQDPQAPAIGDAGWLRGDTATAASTGDRFYNEIMGFDDDAAANIPDLVLPVGSVSVAVDIFHDGATPLAGSGAEFGSGAGGMAAVAVHYDLDARGTAAALNNSRSRITARYRKVPKTAGGL